MKESDLLFLAKKYGNKILDGKYANRRIASLCKVSAAEAPRIRKLARQIRNGELEEEELDEGETVFYEGEYIYVEETDTYFTFLSGKKPIMLSGDKQRQLVRDYSNFDGSPHTINEIARTFAMQRSVVVQYLRAHGITHDKEPFTNEELVQKNEEELVADALQMIRQSMFSKLERAKLKEMEKAANNWHQAEAVLVDIFLKELKNKEPEKVERIELKAATTPFAVVLGMSDVHVGKRTDPCETNNPNAYQRDVLLRVIKLLERVIKFGRPEKIIFPVGNDLLHVDNIHGTTAKGTPQDIYESPVETLLAAAVLMENVVQMLRRFAPVEIIYVPGNHDELLSMSVVLYLRGLYNNTEDVVVNQNKESRAYVTYGKNLIGFTHGRDVSQTERLAGLMSTEASEHWHGCPHRTIYTGDKHSEKVEVDTSYGVTRRQLPSLTGTDRWHNKKGFVGKPKDMPAFVHDKEEGLIATFYAPKL